MTDEEVTLKESLRDWRADAAGGLTSMIIAVGGGTVGVWPVWVTAVQGFVGGVLLTIAAMKWGNVSYQDSVLLDGVG